MGWSSGEGGEEATKVLGGVNMEDPRRFLKESKRWKGQEED